MTAHILGHMGLLVMELKRDDDRIGDHPPKVHPGAISCQRQGSIPEEDPGSALLLCM